MFGTKEEKMIIYFIGMGIVLTIVVLLLLMYIFPMFSMKPLTTGKIPETDIIAIKNRSNNLFFIPVGEEWLVIDAGSDKKAVQEEMQKMSIDTSKVKNVFLTHTDYDHVAALVLFTNAKIYMSKDEKQMIDGSTNRQFIKKNELPKLGSSNNSIKYMKDNEVISVGRHHMRIIFVPGHTKGSAMYSFDGKYLFTGDAFKIADDQIQVHPYTMNRKQAEETIRNSEDELKKHLKIFMAHYGVINQKS